MLIASRIIRASTAVPYRRLAAITNGTKTAHASNAAQANPAGVARPVAVTETRFPLFTVTVPFISSGCGAAVDVSGAEPSDSGFAACSSDTFHLHISRYCHLNHLPLTELSQAEV